VAGKKAAAIGSQAGCSPPAVCETCGRSSNQVVIDDHECGEE